MDSAGNQETTRTATYYRDRLGPAAVANFTASPAGANVNLTWTNPAAPDFADVVIARVSDLSATVPTDGAAVVVGATVGASTVIYVGNAQAFTDTAPGAGNHTYVAWAHYSSGVYAEGRADGARLEPVAQTCAITIDVTSGTATVTAQPTEWTLAIANYSNKPPMNVFTPSLRPISASGTGWSPDVKIIG